MATLIVNHIEHQLDDGDKISEACKSSGVVFSCNAGACGSCLIKVLEGADNLNDLTAEEKDLGLDKTTRLACRCKIKTGMVKITF
ncbi:MAG: 2Fe-2S iron-sulfur cluster-binding protein [Candidatus Zapsychrus exili]|nr:2Fe-2S iron-sulfur cluster-binding protein [Candidatus Zapsychrus exili]